jgi:hypothetical protein
MRQGRCGGRPGELIADFVNVAESLLAFDEAYGAKT